MIYEDYLRQTGTQLFYGADTYWCIYQGCLVPAAPIPTFVNVDTETSKRLLAESKAYLMKWSSDPSDKETPWWWMVCDEYNPAKCSHKMRSHIKKGYQTCAVRQISSEWLAEFGYECYKGAFRRYKNATPASEETFKSSTMANVGYENWGVFIEDRLVGYEQCFVEGEQGIAIIVAKYDPDYMKYYSAYAIEDALLREYVIKRGLPVSAGTRSVSHNISVQEFLLKFGYRRQYCRLNVMYQPYLKLAVSCLYPFRSFIPDKGIMHKVRAILFQEEIKRVCQ